MAGRPQDVSDEEILREIALLPAPVATAGELADSLEMTNSGVNKRLDDLVDEGYIKQKTVGARAKVYWLTEKGKEKASEA